MNGMTEQMAVESRQKFAEAWNSTIIAMWQEQITLLGVVDSHALLNSLTALPIVPADAGFHSFKVSEQFLNYGFYQEFGTGREFSLDNGGDLEFLEESYRIDHRLDKPRKVGPAWGGGMTSGHARTRRPWFSKKYYASVMKMKEFMAESVGEEFVGAITDALMNGGLKTIADYNRRNHH